MRLLVCGGRDYGDRLAIMEALKALAPECVITGGARGADAIADKAAESLGIARMVFPANWNGDGKAAGPIRNARMLKEGRPDLVLAYPGGRGTADMIAKARRADVPVREIQA